MKKAIILILGIILMPGLAYAPDLSDYPNIILREGKLDAVIIVGDNAPANDVVAASDIIGSLQQDGIKTTPVKMSNEVPDIYSQNIIVVGNACTNPIAAKSWIHQEALQLVQVFFRLKT